MTETNEKEDETMPDLDFTSQIKECLISMENETKNTDLQAKCISKIRDLLSSFKGDLSKEECGELASMGYRLWNVGLKISGEDIDIRACHLACDAIHFSLINDDQVEETLLQLSKLYIATASKWLKGKNAVQAETCIESAEQVLRKVKSESDNKSLCSLSLCTTKEELAKHQGNKQDAYTWSSNALEVIGTVTDGKKERHTYASTNYMTATEFFKAEDYQMAEKWLQLAYRSLLNQDNRDKSLQARILRMLTATYIELGDIKKAIAAGELSETEESHPSSKWLLVRANFASSDQEKAERSLNALIHDPTVTTEICLQACKLAAEYGNSNAAASALSALRLLLGRTMEGSLDPAQQNMIGKIRGGIVELMTSDAIGDFEGAAIELSNIVNGHQTGVCKLEPDTIEYVAFLGWETARKFYKNQSYQNALEWFQRSAPLVNMPIECARAEILCYIGLTDWVSAKTILDKSPESDANTLFLASLINIGQGIIVDEQEVILKKMCESVNFQSDYLDILAQESHSKGYIGLCIHVLELILTSTNTEDLKAEPGTMERLLYFARVLKSLFKLEKDTHKLLYYGKIGISLLSIIAKSLENPSDSDSQWGLHRNFFCIEIWNMGVESASGSDSQQAMELFELCYEAIKLPKLEGELTLQEKEDISICLMMFIQNAVQICRNKLDTPLLKKTLNRITECQEITKELELTLTQQVNTSKLSLLFVYEFEVHCLLKDSQVMTIARSAVNSRQVSITILELMAAACSSDSEATKLLVNAAISKCRQEPEKNAKNLGVLYHHLLNKSPSFKTAEEAVQVMTKEVKKGEWPPVEALWLKTLAWNCGVSAYMLRDFDEAEKWMSLAVSLFDWAPGNETQMLEGYGKVLERIRSH